MGTELTRSGRNKSYPSVINGNPEFTPTADQLYHLGMQTRDIAGRTFRYAQNGSVALTPALMTQSAPIVTELYDALQTGYTNDANKKRIVVLVPTLSGLLDGQLTNGTITIQSSTSIGSTYAIANNEWLTGDTLLAIDLYEPLNVATSGTSRVTIVGNLYSGVLAAKTTLTGVSTGVPNVAVPAGYFFWSQTKGVCGIIRDADDTLVIGQAAGLSAAPATAGRVGTPALAGPVWGTVVTLGVVNEVALINLNLE